MRVLLVNAHAIRSPRASGRRLRSWGSGEASRDRPPWARKNRQAIVSRLTCRPPAEAELTGKIRDRFGCGLGGFRLTTRIRASSNPSWELW
jgi:hypothetical protein